MARGSRTWVIAESLHPRRGEVESAFMPDGPARQPGWWRGRPLLEARKELADAFERAYLIDLMRTSRGRIDEGARRAGVSTRSLSDMLKRHGLRRERVWTEKAIREVQ